MTTTHVRRTQMFHLPISRPSSSTQLIALLFALALAVAACSGSPDVESDDASATVGSDGDAETSEDGDDEDGDQEDVAVEAETDAMGEDDAMSEEDVDGTIEAPDGEEVADGGTVADSALSSAELVAAFEAGTSDRFALPFMYLTVDQDCDGCAETMSLYYVPGEEKASILTLAGAYIDGVAQSDFSAVDPILEAGDPRRVAEQLSDTDATFGVDPVSGAITSWTLAGNTVTVRCLQVDTRPIDMRTELCENSIIG